MKITIIFFYACLIILICFLFMYSRRNILQTNPHMDSHTCPLTTCGSLDPVSDPVYNMGEIAKNSLLLEDHIAIKAKRSRLLSEALFITNRIFRRGHNTRM